jgi:two-component system, cell cycle sensor histidine kinase and response regulator CckA
VEVTQDRAREEAIIYAGRYVTVAVKDNGAGMADDVRCRVFEPFFTTKERGTGLGLSTVYGIVKQSGGYIWVDSKVGEGSTFTIYLPRVEEAVEEGAAAIPESPHHGTETVLVVDDDDAVRPLMRQMLERHGYKVLEAENAGAALLLSERHAGKIDLLLTDVVLDQMRGDELAARILAGAPALRVLYVSGYTEDTIVRQGVLKSGIAFLQKPFTAEVLAAKVRSVLG